jgi:FolB domain-containing protein
MADPPADVIHIRNLRCRCIIGVNPGERDCHQDVVLNISIETDLFAAGRSDRIEDTIDYKELKRAILDHVEASSYFLIERMAESVADLCLRNTRARRVRVVVDKPGALRFADSVAVEIVREHDPRGT